VTVHLSEQSDDGFFFYQCKRNALRDDRETSIARPKSLSFLKGKVDTASGVPLACICKYLLCLVLRSSGPPLTKVEHKGWKYHLLNLEYLGWFSRCDKSPQIFHCRWEQPSLQPAACAVVGPITIQQVAL